MAKIRSRWAYGIFVGVRRRRSGELWVANKKGEVVKMRAVKRIPLEDRLSEDCANWVKYTMWHKYDNDPAADGDIPDGKEVETRRRQMQDLETTDDAQRDDLMEKKVRGSVCAGCRSWFRGLARQEHTKEY